MSTYTDLHNRIKENLTILRKPGSKDDGMSPQKVILINPENQFYGTFNGKMNVTEGILSGLKIANSELDNVKLDGATIDGVSLSELKDTIDVNTQDIEQLQKDAKCISASHDELSTGLSSAIDGLSVKLNEKLDNTVEDVKKSIGGVVGDVAILSDGFGDLSTKVEALSSGTLNGVVYRGQLVLYHDIYTLPRQLFNDDPACCLLEGTQASLKNGWMWRIALDRQNVSGDYVHVNDPNTGKELDLGEGDYIIIKNHLTGLYEVVPDNKMRLDDFDVINAQDEDDTKLAVLKQVSAYLDNRIDEDLISAKTYTDEMSAALSIAFDSNYLHKAGGIVSKLSVEGELSVAGKTIVSNAFVVDDRFNANTGTYAKISDAGVVVKTHARTLLKSDDQIEIKTNAPIIEEASRFRGKFTNGLEIESDAGLASLSVNGKTIQSTLDDLSNHLDGKKLDVELARQLSSQLMISTDLPSNVAFDYLSSENILRLSIQGTPYDVDVTKFLDDKIIENVYTTIEDGKIWLHIVFKTSSSGDQKIIDICVNDLVHPYWAGHGISVDNNLCIHIADYFYDQVQNIQSYVDELSGPVGPYIGIIPSLSAAIDKIDLAQTQELFFGGLIELDTSDTSKHYPTIGAFLSTEIGGADAPSQVRNNSYFDIKFFHGLQTSSVIITEDGLSVGNGDQLIIHEHNPIEGEEVKFISWADLKLIDENAAGNVYLIKAGVSRYEFEAEATKRADDDNYISSWIKRNFANTSADNELSTTILNYDISATKALSVASNAYVLSDLSVVGSLFVNGAQLGITVEPVDPDVPGGETETVARTVADEVEFTTSSADNAPTISITRNAISFRSAPVYVSTSSFIISNDQTKVIDATSSQVEILSVLNVKSDKATITMLSVGALSTDFSQLVDFNSMSSILDISADLDRKMLLNDGVLSTAIDKKIFIDGLSTESLSATHISEVDFYQRVKDGQILSNELYIVSSDYINAYGEQIKNLATPTELSDATTKEYVDVISSTLSSQIQKLSDDLSSEISSLEVKAISNDTCLSTAIDRKIFINGLSTESLCAIHISQDDFYQKVENDEILSNELYIVSSDYINAYGEQLKNLAEPTDLSDAATKEYVDNADFSISSQLSGLISAMYGDLEHVATDSIISGLEQKSCISNVICAVVGIRDTLVDLRQTLSTMLGL